MNNTPRPPTVEEQAATKEHNAQLWFGPGNKDKEVGSGYRQNCRNGNIIKWWWTRTQGGFWTVQLTDAEHNQISINDGECFYCYTKVEVAREVQSLLVENQS